METVFTILARHHKLCELVSNNVNSCEGHGLAQG